MRLLLVISVFLLAACQTTGAVQTGPDPLLDLAPVLRAGPDDLAHAARDPERLRQEAGRGLEEMVEGAGCGCVESDSGGGFSDPGGNAGPPDIDLQKPATVKVKIELPE